MHRREAGKLKIAAAAFYETAPEIAEGFTAADYETDPIEVWPENWNTWLLFSGMQTQWYIGMNGRTGLNYLVLFAMIDKLNLSKEESDLMFLDIQVMEYSALEEMAKHKGA